MNSSMKYTSDCKLPPLRTLPTDPSGIPSKSPGTHGIHSYIPNHTTRVRMLKGHFHRIQLLHSHPLLLQSNGKRTKRRRGYGPRYECDQGDHAGDSLSCKRSDLEGGLRNEGLSSVDKQSVSVFGNDNVESRDA